MMQLALFVGMDLSVPLLSAIKWTCFLDIASLQRLSWAAQRIDPRPWQNSLAPPGLRWARASMIVSAPGSIPQWATVWSGCSLPRHREEEELLNKHWTLLQPAFTAVPFFLNNDPSATIPGLLCLQTLESSVTALFRETGLTLHI